MLGIEADAVRVEKLLVLPVVDDQLMGDRQQQRHVFGRADGDEVGVKHLCGVVEDRVDADEASACRFRRLEITDGVALA